jgi:hypothetical protein
MLRGPITFHTGRAPSEVTFSLDASPRCVRVFVAVDPEATISARLLSRDGKELAMANLERSFAILGRDGPVCVSTEGTYRVVVQSRQETSGVLTVRAAAFRPGH